MSLLKHRPDYSVPVGQIIEEQIEANGEYRDWVEETGESNPALWLSERAGISYVSVWALSSNRFRITKELAAPIGLAIGVDPSILLRIDHLNRSLFWRAVRWCRRMANWIRNHAAE